jgi:hypothetical protein
MLKITVISLPGILTYTKCMLVKNITVIPLSRILTYTKCILAKNHIISNALGEIVVVGFNGILNGSF